MDKFGIATGTVLLVLPYCGIYGTVFYITFCAQMMIIVKQCPPRSMPLLVHRLHLNAECSLMAFVVFVLYCWSYGDDYKRDVMD